MKKKKRLLFLLLTMLFGAGIFSVSAFAEGSGGTLEWEDNTVTVYSEQELRDAVDTINGESEGTFTIKLGDDIVVTGGERIEFKRNAVILLGEGNTICFDSNSNGLLINSAELTLGGEDYEDTLVLYRPQGMGTASAIINMTSSAVLNMYDGATIGPGTTLSQPAGVQISNGTFNMYGGTITDCNNTVSTAGGVTVLNGTFNMYGGTIQNCVGVNGGAVAISPTHTIGPGAYGASFNMSGGTIKNCSDEYYGGGAVCIYTSKKVSFSMTGGTITGCEATYAGYGGAIFIYTTDSDSYIEISGGTISGNSGKYGGGIFLYRGSLNVSDEAKIYNNTAALAGDDFYSNGTKTYLSLSSVPEGLTLEQTGKNITGWYMDGEPRWSIGDEGEEDCVKPYYPPKDPITDEIALKAAHGYTVTVTPADITVYMGGERGYSDVVDEDDDIKSSSSLPEPVYFIDVPEAFGLDNDDLEDNITFICSTDGVEKTWNLTYAGKYDTRSVYYMADSDNRSKAELQFTDSAGNRVISDYFELTADSLSQTLSIGIYCGNIDQNKITAIVTMADGSTKTCDVETVAGSLTVRGASKEQPDTTAIASGNDRLDNLADITAMAPDDAAYFLNNTNIRVEKQNVKLLADSEPEDIRTYLMENLEKEPGVSEYANGYILEFKYLSLVDVYNGNAVIRQDDGQKMTVYWYLPDYAEADSAAVLHFKGMYRENGVGTENYEIEEIDSSIVTEGGKRYVKFESSSLSPFILAYRTKEITYTINSYAGKGGSISPYGSVEVLSGDSRTFTIDAESNYSISDVLVDGKSVGAVKTYTFENVTENHTIKAIFTYDKGGESVTAYNTLHYESNGGTKYPNERYNENIVVSLDKIPDRDGFTFIGWYADKDLTERITEIKMTSDKTVYAGWEAIEVPSRLNGGDHFAYVIGYNDGTVRPENNITRAEVAVIFFRLLSPEIRDEYLTEVNTFEDVCEGMWYNTAVSTLSRLGIIKGRTTDTFEPYANITRAEFAAICARFDDSDIVGTGDFTDIYGHWAKDEIDRAAALDWIHGYTDRTFRPDNNITRAEAMTMINHVLRRIPETEADLLDGMKVWPDNLPGMWYYLAVQEATNSHDFERRSSGYEYWTGLNADPDWTIYK